MTTRTTIIDTDKTQQNASLMSFGFVALNTIFFIASAAIASFFYLQQHLQSLGVAPVWTGLIIGADAVASFLLQPFLAPFLHGGNARRWMLAGIIVMTAALFSYGSARSLPALIAVRVVQGAGFVCLIAAMMAAMTSYIPPSLSGKAFSFISLVRLVPYALVPPLVTFLIDRSFSFPAIVAGFAALTLLSMGLLFLIQPQPRTSGDGENNRGVGFRGLMDDLRQGPVIMLLAANLLFFTTYTILFFYILGFGRERGIVQPGLFFTIATAVMIAVRLFGSAFFDKINKSLVSFICLVILAVGYIIIAQSKGWMFLGLAVLFGFAWGVVMPLLNAIIFDISEPRFRGLNLNLTLVVMQGAFFLGPLLGGIVVGTWGYSILFYLCCPLSLTAGLLLHIIRQKGVVQP